MGELLTFQRPKRQIHAVDALSADITSVHEKNQQRIYLLPRTGFNVIDQVQQLKRDFIQRRLEGSDTQSIINGWLQKTEQDIQGFKIEYLCEGPLFPIVLDYKEVNGEKRIVSPLYDNKVWANTVTDKERHGSVKQSVQSIEKFLLEAQPGSMAVMTSPTGWSGLETSDNQDIIYPDAQTYCIEKRLNGSLRGFTIKTDMSLFQNEELLIRLGITPEQLGYLQNGKNNLQSRERLSNIVRNVAYLPSGQSIENIVAIIKDIKGTNTAFIDTKGEKRTFQEIFRTLQNPESLWTLDNQTKDLVAVFNLYVQRQLMNGHVTEEIIDNIQTALGMTIMKLAALIRPSQKSINSQTTPPPMQVLGMLQQIGGCAGGGMIVTGGIVPRVGMFMSSATNSSESCPSIKCGRSGCGWIANDSEVKAIQEGKLTCCPKVDTDSNGNPILNEDGEPRICGWKPKAA